jgi:hypothetical protein
VIEYIPEIIGELDPNTSSTLEEPQNAFKVGLKAQAPKDQHDPPIVIEVLTEGLATAVVVLEELELDFFSQEKVIEVKAIIVNNKMKFFILINVVKINQEAIFFNPTLGL